MDRNIRLKILGIHHSGDETEKVETKTEAQYFHKDGAHYFFYEESEEDFGGKQKTRLKYSDGILEILRSGTDRTELIFEKERTHRTMYPTPAGSFALEIVTGELTFCEQPDQIRIYAEYHMRMDESFETECSIEITAYIEEKPIDNGLSIG